MTDCIDRQAAIAIIDNIMANGADIAFRDANRIKKAISELPSQWVSVTENEFKQDRNNCLKCEYRHKINGNCIAVGGFCTAVPAKDCQLLAEYLKKQS